ncbi:MAG: HPr family phosphocarrier protein [Ureaplasma sp.]|nr:HPr family phosphocarrier protein [Ureaplasma sp.]MDE7221818.1 HPr family phosphocarrier protein [Ureaplasma sp.]
MEKQLFKIKTNNFNIDVITTITNLCSQYKSKIYFIVNGNRANSKSLINLISLDLENSKEFEIEIDGQDGYQAINVITDYLKNKSII